MCIFVCLYRGKDFERNTTKYIENHLYHQSLNLLEQRNHRNKKHHKEKKYKVGLQTIVHK